MGIMTDKPHLIVIGNGMAGCRAVEEILERDAGKFRVTIFGAEPRVNYNRIMLSPLLAGEKTFDDIVINDQAWYDAGFGRSSGCHRPQNPDRHRTVGTHRKL
jgi:nitrite reductase (NADH) large subunit